MIRKAAIDIPNDAVAELCKRWRMSELSFFGSVLRDDFDSSSDVDVLVSFEPDARWSLLDIGQMEKELAEMFGRSVDLVTRRSIEQSQNWIRREAILRSAEPLYVAR